MFAIFEMYSEFMFSKALSFFLFLVFFFFTKKNGSIYFHKLNIKRSLIVSLSSIRIALNVINLVEENH